MTEEPPSTRRCRRCGAALPDPMLGGHCPRCLIHTSLTTVPAEVEPPPDAPLIFMRSFGDYELLDEIARGGMGVVYRARQRSLNRLVAVKMLLAGEFASADFVRRFRKEAEAAASLRHPNIVAIYEVGQQDGQHFFSMEFIDGCNLADLVRERPLPAPRAAGYLKIITEAVAFAHGRGTVHRDLKPSNILIDAFDQPRITDFGLARQLRGDDHLTLSGQALGSPAYMPPEQAGVAAVVRRRADLSEDAGPAIQQPDSEPARRLTTAATKGNVGPCSDIYGLGAILYHLVTGRPPFQGDTVPQVLRQVQEEEPVPPRRLNPSIPEDLQTICLKCLEKDPARRYGSAHELADELARFLRGEPIRARPVSPAGKVWLWCRRRPAIAALSASVLLLLVIVAVGSSAAAWRISVARQAEQAEREKAESANIGLQGANIRLADTIGLLELQRAEDLFRANEAAAGVAHLAALLRRDPSNSIAASRLVSALVHRNWVLPAAPRMRHEQNVRMIVFSPDEQQVLSVSGGNHASVRNASRGELLFTLDHSDRVQIARYSSDGRLIVSASRDGVARIWNATNGQPVTTPLRHDGEVLWAEFAPDGHIVVTAAADKTAKIWDTATGQLRHTLASHDSKVLRAHFGPTGERLATVTESGSIRLWESASGKFLFELDEHRTRVNALAFSPEGNRIVAAGSHGKAWIWNSVDAPSRGLALVHSRDIFPIWHVTFSPDGQFVLTTSEDTTARVWNVTDGFPVSQPLLHEGGVVFGDFSPDGQAIVTTSTDTSARIWDWRLGRSFVQPLRHRKPVRYAAFSADGRRLQTVSSDSTSQLWDL
ncbi:MAG: serine/threonine protein kinase, partial [Verrucomicrobiales bacterium]|nr:serine/threonine protein kinase [Verrucomicrobiales bacterium]